MGPQSSSDWFSEHQPAFFLPTSTRITNTGHTTRKWLKQQAVLFVVGPVVLAQNNSFHFPSVWQTFPFYFSILCIFPPSLPP